MNVVIRSEQDDDIQAISAVTEAAFRTSIYGYNNEAAIIEALREADALSISLVAEFSGQVIGHVAVSSVSVSDNSYGWYGLGPISVLLEFRCKGVGSMLMHRALETLKESGASGCVLLGDPDFYERFGFRVVPDLTLPQAPAEYFLALKICGTFPKGTVDYHDSFVAES